MLYILPKGLKITKYFCFVEALSVKTKHLKAKHETKDDIRNLNIPFTEKEVQMLQRKKGKLNWHDFIIKNAFKDEIISLTKKKPKPESILTPEQVKAIQEYERNFMNKHEDNTAEGILKEPNWQVYWTLIENGLSDEKIEQLLTPIIMKPKDIIKNRIYIAHHFFKELHKSEAKVSMRKNDQ